MEVRNEQPKLRRRSRGSPAGPMSLVRKETWRALQESSAAISVTGREVRSFGTSATIRFATS